MEKHKLQVQTKIIEYDRKRINDIKKYAHFIDFGSEISCYNLTSRQVIKFFNLEQTDPKTKLLLSDSIYGNHTYPFVDEIITSKYSKEIIAYTMKYIKGSKLDKIESLNLFYNLSYSMLTEYLTILTLDSKNLANNGIKAFDCMDSNIILSPTGFRQIDCIDFILQDRDPSIIEKDNIKLMCLTIWDSLIVKYLSTFLANNNLNQQDFITTPIEFIKELQKISQNYSDNEIITLNDTKKLSRKK